MKIRDYLKIISLNLIREKKKWSYILTIFICTILSLILFVFWENVNKIINVTLKNEIGYRTIDIHPRFNTEVTSFEELNDYVKNDINDIMKISNVLDAFNSQEWSIVLKSNISKNGVDGTITLLRAKETTLPTIISGRSFTDNEKEVAICPKMFYPNIDPMYVDKDKIIDGESLIGTTFSVEFNDYVLNEYLMPEENNTYIKEFEIIGIYNTYERMNDSSTCYISSYDMEKISSTMNSWNESSLPVISVIVDDINNVQHVLEKINEMGFESTGLRAHLDTNMINTIRLSIVVVFSLILTTIIIITVLYIKKKIKSEEKTIGILRANGYSKKNITLLYMLQLLINNFLIFVLSCVLFIISYNILIVNVEILISARIMLNGLAFSVISFILSFIIIVLVPCIVLIFYIRNCIKHDIVDLIRSEE